MSVKLYNFATVYHIEGILAPYNLEITHAIVFLKGLTQENIYFSL